MSVDQDIVVSRSPRTPDGYWPLPIRGLNGVVRRDALDGVRDVLAQNTLAGWAAAHPFRREMRGRGLVYAVTLPPAGPHVVVRHARHGGLLAGLTGDRFLKPTRAPHELRVALRLAAAGVPTPSVVAYVLYPAGPLLYRVDVATEEIAGGLDLPEALARWPDHRAAMLRAVGRLLTQLAQAGARHPDLNVKNILLTPPAGADPVAHVLDVDRIVFDEPGRRVATANAARLGRSARKWARRGQPLLTVAELARMTTGDVAEERA